VGVAGEDRVGEREEGEVSTDVVREKSRTYPASEPSGVDLVVVSWVTPTTGSGIPHPRYARCRGHERLYKDWVTEINLRRYGISEGLRHLRYRPGHGTVGLLCSRTPWRECPREI
jgi:hypothetical protein